MTPLLAILLAASTTIPFRWTPGQIEVQVSVNGTAPRWFIVDTGAEYAVLQAEFAAALGLRTSPRRGREFADGVSLRFGGIELKNQEVMVLPLENFKRQGRPIVGLLGYDFFAAHVVTFDFARRTLIAHRPGGFRPPARATVVPLSFVRRLPVVPLTLRFPGGPALPVRAMLDTGASSAMVLRYPFAREHGLLELARQHPPRRAGSVERGAIDFLRLPAEEVVIGPHRFSEPLIWIYPEPIGAGGATETDGVIGNEILSRFRVTIDYSRASMYLEIGDSTVDPGVMSQAAIGRSAK